VDTRRLEVVASSYPMTGIAGLAYAPHGGPLVVAGVHGTLAFLNPRTGAVVQSRSDQRGGQLTPSISADGRRMATLAVMDGIALWTLRGGRVTGPARMYRPAFIARYVSLSPDGRRMAVASDLGIQIVDVATLKPLARLAGSNAATVLAQFSADGRYVIGGSEQAGRGCGRPRRGSP
jgi:hypothetical protein